MLVRVGLAVCQRCSGFVQYRIGFVKETQIQKLCNVCYFVDNIHFWAAVQNNNYHIESL